MARNQTHAPVRISFPPHGVCVRESRHAADFAMEPVRWEFVVLLYVVQGSGTLRLSTGGTPALELRRDRMVLLPPRTGYRLVDRPGDALWLYLVCLQPDLLAGTGLRLPGVRLYDPPADACVEWRNALRDILFRRESVDGLQALRQQHTAWRMLDTVLSAGAAPGRRDAGSVEARVRRYVAELPGSFHAQTDLDGVARSLGMSRRAFTLAFQALTGTSWLQAVTALRLAHARRLLQETPLPVNAIVFECGYNDPSAFYRAFRAATGMTPLAWREQASRAGGAGLNRGG